MFRSLDDFCILLGLPVYRSVLGGESGGARVAAHWACGCVGSGTSFTRLSLRTCNSHRAGRVELPAAAI